MNSLVAWLLGTGAAGWPSDAALAFEAGTPPSGTRGLLAILAVLGALALVVAIYRRECRRRLTRRRAGALIVLRLAIIALLALTLIEPRLSVTTVEIVDGRTLVFLDESLSLAVVDPIVAPGQEAVARAVRQRAVIEREFRRERATEGEPACTLLEWLARDNHVSVYAYGGPAPQALGHLELGATRASAPWPQAPEPRTDSTDLAAAMRAAAAAARNEPLAALIVIGDGRNTAGEDPLAVATELFAERAVPVHTVTIGSDAPPINLRLAEFIAPDRVFATDPIVLEVAVEAHGTPAREHTLEIVALPQTEGGKERVLDSRKITIGGDIERQLVGIQVPSGDPGRLRLEARVAPIEGEVTTADNRASALVHVLAERTRVLLVSGSPSQEYHYLKELLRRERTVELSVWLCSADRDFPQEGNRPLTELPLDAKSLESYDVIVLLDPDPLIFAAERIAAIRTFVEHSGGGLAFVAGEKFTLPLLLEPSNAGLVELLPIVPDDDVAREYVGRGREHVTPWKLAITPEGLDHPIARLAADLDVNRRIWQKLPGVYWHLPVERARPGAKTIARHSDPKAVNRDGPHPLIVAHFYGPGRTLFVATDELPAWRSTAARSYARFWLQAIRYLAQGRLLGGRERVSLTLATEQAPLGSRVQVDAELRGEDRQPLAATSLDVAVHAPDGESRTLRLDPVPGRAGSFSGVLVPWSLGMTRLEVETVPDGGGQAARAEATLQVLPPARELADSRADPAAMRALSAISPGGVALAPDDAHTLADVVTARRRERRHLGQPIELWDSPLYALALIGLLAAEWILRKRSDLV